MCGGATRNHARLSKTVKDEFQGILSLHNTTSVADGVISEVGLAVEAIRDLIILVRNSKIRNKAAIIQLLDEIIESGYTSRGNLNAYVARVSVSVTAYGFLFY